MIELPHTPFEDDAIPKAADQEPGPAIAAQGSHAYLYAATCAALRSWSQELGFEVAHIGVAGEPLARVAGLRGAGHAALSYFLRPYDDDLSFGDWHLVPLDMAAADAAVPDCCEAWAGTLRIALPAGVGPDDLGRRLAMMLRPLEAHHCAQLPEAIERRAEQQKLLPVMPRYNVGHAGTTLAQDLYRLSEEPDLAFVADALRAALAMLGEGREVFDRVVETLGSAPTACQAGYAVDAEAREAAHAR